MSLQLRTRSVGPWPMNTFALVCPVTSQSALVDPGADPETLLAMLADTTPTLILITHSDPDHIGALKEMRVRLNVPVLAHPGPYVRPITPDRTIGDGEVIRIGQGMVRAYATPGHTADMLSFAVEGGSDIIVGDTIFAGGPGRTKSAADFQTTLQTLRSVVLHWPNGAVCHPGHGPSFQLGDKRAAIEAFLARDHGEFFGDAEWEDKA